MAVLGVTLAGSRLADALAFRVATDELKREALAIRGAMEMGATPPDYGTIAHSFGNRTGFRVSLISDDGTIIGDSEFSDSTLALLEHVGGRPEIADARDRGSGFDRRVSSSTHRLEILVAVKGGPGYVRISAPAGAFQWISRRVTLLLLSGAILSLVLVSSFWFAAVFRTTRNYNRLTASLEAIAASRTPSYPQPATTEELNAVLVVKRIEEVVSKLRETLGREGATADALIEPLDIALLAADAHGNVVKANRVARQLLGYGEEERLPSLQQLFHDPKVRGLIDRAPDSGAPKSLTFEFGDRWMLASVSYDAGTGLVFTLQDITPVRRIEDASRDLVANVSHELKTPLTNILGYAETLADGGLDDDTRKKFLAILRSNAARMNNIVEDLLDLARYEAGNWKPKLQRIDLEGHVTAIRDTYADEIDRRRLNVVCNVPSGLSVETDPEGLRIILANLLDNAVRYTPDEGRIEITGLVEGGWIRLVVLDTGPGIPPDQLIRVFERFYRGDWGRSRDKGGTGLGLAIVQSVARAMGGSVSVDSRVSSGTRFEVRLPVHAAGERA